VEEVILAELDKRSAAIEEAIKQLHDQVSELGKRVDALQSSLNDIKALLSELLIELKSAINEQGERQHALLTNITELLIKLFESCRS